MHNIGGNIELIIQKLSKDIKYDKNGKKIVDYESRNPIVGWIDLITGDSNYIYKAKIEDSTHVFICDYVNLDDIDIEESRAIVKGEIYDIKYIDIPMELNEHLEIYLKKIGGQ